jgi:hypothetical protein
MNKLQKMVKKLDVFLFDGFYQQTYRMESNSQLLQVRSKNIDFFQSNDEIVSQFMNLKQLIMYKIMK